MPLISVVVPCYNEEAVVERTYRQLTEVLRGLEALDYELLFIDDGSKDRTADQLRTIQLLDSKVRFVALARNFGHQIAVTAGIEHSRGDAVVLIDADLQDPPELVPAMIETWQRGFDVVYGVRVDRAGESRFKLWTARLFYRLIARLSDTPIAVDTGDFRLMDRKVVDAFLLMPERDRFIRGMVGWVGFRQTGMQYRRSARAAGQSKYPLTKMLRFAIDGITSFSAVPLRVATWCGFAAASLAMCLVIWALAARIFTTQWVPGWAALFIAVLFMGGVQLIALGVMGEYIGRIYIESKRRPLYVTSERLGFGAERQPMSSAAAGRHALAPDVQIAGFQSAGR